MDEGEDELQAINSLREKALQSNREAYPNVNDGVWVNASNIGGDSVSERKELTLEQSITNSRTISELMTFKLLAFSKGQPKEIQELYENKVRELKKT